MLTEVVVAVVSATVAVEVTDFVICGISKHSALAASSEDIPWQYTKYLGILSRVSLLKM
jgi:hypothetical protein